MLAFAGDEETLRNNRRIMRCDDMTCAMAHAAACMTHTSWHPLLFEKHVRVGSMPMRGKPVRVSEWRTDACMHMHHAAHTSQPSEDRV